MATVEVRWPNGDVERLQNLAADAVYTVVEGQGIKNTQALPPVTGDATPANAK